MNKGISHSILVMSILFVVSSLYLLVFGISTSSLYDSSGNDSYIFRLFGKGLLEGKILYKDMFDHKGPIQFFIQALGVFISPRRIGIFLIQVVNLTLFLFFARKISLLYTTQKQSWIVIFLSLSYLLIPFEGGNLTEEYSLLFLVIPMYLFLKDCSRSLPLFPLKHTFVYGMCFTIIAFIRITNAIAIVAVIFSIALSLIVDKRWKLLLNHTVIFSGASMVVIVPLFAYFYIQGALYDMIYGTFLFNFKYAMTGNGAFRPLQIVKIAYVLIPVLYCVMNAYLYHKRYNKPHILSFSICLSLLSFYVSLSGNCYFHYQIINILLVIFGVSLGFINWGNRVINNVQRTIIIIAAIISFFLIAKYVISINDSESIYVSPYPEIEIPEEDKGRVIAYNVSSEWYFLHDVVPCHKYFFSQDKFGSSIDSKVWEEFNEMMTTTPPLWIIVSKQEMKNKVLERILSEGYEIFTQNEGYIVYTYKSHFDFHY